MAKQSKSFGNTQLLGALLERIESGDPAAREELLQEAQERLRRMASKMLTGFPALRQQGRAETGMILNDALLKLNESFGQVEFQSPRHFINVAAQKMRFYLIDLARKHKIEIESRQQEIPDFELRESHAIEIGETQNALTQDHWAAFHIAVDRLPDDEKEVFTLRYYGAWSREETAIILGVAEKTVTRRYSRAMEQLSSMLR